MSDAPTETPITEPAGPPPQPQPPASRPFRLMRVRDGKVLGGVAGGLARAAGIDASVARLAVIAFALTGVGVIAYIALWFVLPQEAPWRGEVADVAPPPNDRYVRIGLGISAALGVLDMLSGIGGLLAWNGRNWGNGPGRDFGPGSGFPLDFGGGLGLLLIGFGAALLITRRRDRGPDDPMSPTPSGTESSWSPSPGGAEPFTTAATLEDGPGPATPFALIATRVFGWLVLVWTVVAVAGGGLLWWAGAIRPGAPELAIPLVAITFIAAAWTLVRSRRIGIILVAVGAVLVSLGVAAQADVDGDLGVRHLRLNDQTLQPSYRVAAGQIVLDLRDMEVVEGRRTVAVDVGAGQITVKLPASVTSVVTARTGLGGLAVLGEVRGGTDEFVRVRTSGCPERGELVLRLRTRVGHIEVEGPGGAFPLVTCRPAAV